MKATFAGLDLDRTISLARYDQEPLRRPGVLIAVGDPTARSELGRYLFGQGFDVWAAACGSDALGVYIEHTSTVDVLVIDAGLRDLPGVAFLDRLKAHFPGVPCVFLIDPNSPALNLIAGGGTVLPRSVPLPVLSHRLWDTVAAGPVEVV